MTDIDVMDDVEKLRSGSSKVKWLVLLMLLLGSIICLFFSDISDWFLSIGLLGVVTSIFLFDMATLR